MSLTLTPLSMPEIPVDFRAPPPSPVASGRRSSVTNDEVLTEFLEASLRVPDLVLPDKFFPKTKQIETPPKVDFVSLCFHEDDDLRDVVSDSLATIGCFQLVNHGISPKLIASAAEAAAGIFRVPPGKRAAVKRSGVKPWGFEEYHAGEEEEDESELSEEFVWCSDSDLNLKMEGIWPIGYLNFRKKMEALMTRIEKVAMKMLGVILKSVGCSNFAIENDDDDMIDHNHGPEVGTVCCVYKHKKDNNNNNNNNTSNCLKYEVIRMLIRGTDYSHSLCFHLCNASSEFHVYSKKNWLSFCPEPGSIIITVGDQIQILSGGQYKHVIGRPIFKSDKEESISMAFLYPSQNAKTNFPMNRGRTISLGQQALMAIILTLLYHVLFYVCRRF